MIAEKPSLEKPSVLPSHTTEAGQSFHACKRIYALTLEKMAYVHWEDIHKYMCARMKPVYALVCEHDGPEYPHIHCLYQYKNNKKISGDRLFGAHVEEKVWSPQKYQAYCKAEDEKHKSLGVKSTILIEEGELKKAGGFKTIREVEEMIPDERKDLPIQYKHIIDKMNEEERAKQGFFDMLREIKEDKLRKINIIYAHGKPRVGKTYGAYKYALERYDVEEIGRISITNGFFKFDNPDAKCFVIEEFRSSQLPANSWLQFTDKQGYNCPIKGGFQYCRPETIIVCSIIQPQDLYKDDYTELKLQFIERITEYYEVDADHVWHQCKWNSEFREWEEIDDTA